MLRINSFRRFSQSSLSNIFTIDNQCKLRAMLLHSNQDRLDRGRWERERERDWAAAEHKCVYIKAKSIVADEDVSPVVVDDRITTPDRQCDRGAAVRQLVRAGSVVVRRTYFLPFCFSLRFLLSYATCFSFITNPLSIHSGTSSSQQHLRSRANVLAVDRVPQTTTDSQQPTTDSRHPHVHWSR